MHTQVKEKDSLEISDPAGDFYLNDRHTRPVVLLSGGVGITPMLSMIEHLVYTQSGREVYFLHSSVNKSVQPMADRLKELNKQSIGPVIVHHSKPHANEKKGEDYDEKGIITLDVLKSHLSQPQDYTFYLCGPYGFMQSMFENLTLLGVSTSHIHYEFFGQGKPLTNEEPVVESGYSVRFAKSEKTIIWEGRQSSVLELAESVGIYPENVCRMGTCSTCESQLLSGEVKYDPEPFMEPQEDYALICCAQPASDLILNI
jgi:ferredoxin-NADP reductase